MLEFLAFCVIWVFCIVLNLAIFNLTCNRGEGKRLFDTEGINDLDALCAPFVMFAPFITLLLPLVGLWMLIEYFGDKADAWCKENITLPNWINPEI